MTQPGIFFEGVDIYGLPGKDSYWNATVRDICRALTEAGEPCAPLNLQDQENTTLSFDVSALPPFAITWNFNCGRWVMHQGQQVRITSVLPVKNIALLWDHPFHWIETIQEMRQLDEQMGRPPVHVGVMDDGHMRYLEAAGLPKETIFRWRQAGPPPHAVPAQTDRDIEVVFHGSINDVESFDTFCQRLGLTDPTIMNMVQNCIASIMEEPIDVFDAVIRHVSKPAGADPSPQATANLCREIDRLTRDIRRFGLLSGLKDLDVHYIGHVSPAFQEENPKGVYLGPLPFDEIITHLRRSKVILYDTINFRDAAVMRLFYSIQEGCVPASEMNSHITDEFSDGVDIIALNLRDPIGNIERIRSVLNDPTLAEDLAAKARQTCADSHTWTQRIDPLVRAIRNDTGSSQT